MGSALVEQKDKQNGKEIVGGEVVFTASPALPGCGSVEQSHHSGTVLFSVNIKILLVLLSDLKKRGKGLLMGTKNRCTG